MLRVSGYLLIAISIIHVLVGILICAVPLADIAHNGIFNAVSPDLLSPNFDREAAFWFMMFAPLLFAIGQLCCWAEVQRLTLPAFLGWNLLAVSLVGILLQPISGFWLLILPAILIVLADRRANNRTSSMTIDR